MYTQNILYRLQSKLTYDFLINRHEKIVLKEHISDNGKHVDQNQS